MNNVQVLSCTLTERSVRILTLSASLVLVGGGGGGPCEHFGSGGLGRPPWGVVAAVDWERGAVGACSIAETINANSQ
eukprot:scaffold4856_cov29-Tisochrysis_lutea.AAC.7